MRFSCPQCGKVLVAKDEWIVRRVQCPQCKLELRIPSEVNSVPAAHDNLTLSTSPHDQSSAKVAYRDESKDKNRRRPTNRSLLIAVVLAVLLPLAALARFLGRSSATQTNKTDVAGLTAKSLPESPASTPVPSTSNVQFTGVKKELILHLFQVEFDMGGYRHQFEIAGQDEHQTMLKDKHNDLYLMLQGPAHDLENITLMMPRDSYVDFDETGTRPIGGGAAAFGRVMQRLMAVIDPSWTEELYTWTNEEMGRVLFTKQVAVTRRRGLTVQFYSEDIAEGKSFVMLLISASKQ